MKYRIPLAAAAVTAVLLATGLAWANGSDDTSPSSSTTSSTSRSSTATSSTSPTVTTATAPAPTNPVVATTAPSATSREANSTASIPDGTSQTFVIGEAGTILLGRSDGSLQIIAATPNAGWASEVEVASGREVEGDFRNGTLRVKYNFELEDGTVRVRIENRNDDADGDDDRVIDDDRRGDDDDDNSGPGSGGDDDNSGSGHDDDDGDHDNSGPGGGGSDDND